MGKVVWVLGDDDDDEFHKNKTNFKQNKSLYDDFVNFFTNLCICIY